jgi:hypothetical protein
MKKAAKRGQNGDGLQGSATEKGHHDEQSGNNQHGENHADQGHETIESHQNPPEARLEKIAQALRNHNAAHVKNKLQAIQLNAKIVRMP